MKKDKRGVLGRKIKTTVLKDIEKRGKYGLPVELKKVQDAPG